MRFVDNLHLNKYRHNHPNQNPYFSTTRKTDKRKTEASYLSRLFPLNATESRHEMIIVRPIASAVSRECRTYNIRSTYDHAQLKLLKLALDDDVDHGASVYELVVRFDGAVSPWYVSIFLVLVIRSHFQLMGNCM